MNTFLARVFADIFVVCVEFTTIFRYIFSSCPEWRAIFCLAGQAECYSGLSFCASFLVLVSDVIGGVRGSLCV